MIVYEYPFNERIRTLLRLEDLYEKFKFFVQQEHPMQHHVALGGAEALARPIGTSGLRQPDVRTLVQTCQETGQPCLLVPNFAIGAVLMMRFAEMAAAAGVRIVITGAEALIAPNRINPIYLEGKLLTFQASIAEALGLKDGQIVHTVVADAQLSSAALGQIDPQDGLLKKKSKIKIVLPPALVADLQDLNQVAVSAAFATTDPTTGFAVQQSIQANAFLALQVQMQLQTQIRP